MEGEEPLEQTHFRSVQHHNKFVLQVLSSRDASISLLNLKLNGFGVTASKLLDMVPKYVSPTELTIYVNFNFNTPHCIDPLIFSIQPHLHLS